MSADAADRGPTTPDPARAPAPLTVTVAATIRNASALRRQFQQWAAPVLPPAAAADLTLAVYEALANVVEHAFVTRRYIGMMRLAASVTAAHVEVVVADDGTWRFPTGDAGNRGRGTRLMHSLVTAVRVETGPAGTTVHLRHRIRPSA